MQTLVERVRRRARDCDAVAAQLPAYVAGETDLEDWAARHLSTCLRCQADVARYKRMLRALHALRDEHHEPPPGALSDILSHLDGRRRAPALPLEPWVALAVAAAAGAAGAAGAIVWGTRRRGRAA